MSAFWSPFWTKTFLTVIEDWPYCRHQCIGKCLFSSLDFIPLINNSQYRAADNTTNVLIDTEWSTYNTVT